MSSKFIEDALRVSKVHLEPLVGGGKLLRIFLLDEPIAPI
jgi:hypothetical protein